MRDLPFTLPQIRAAYAAGASPAALVGEAYRRIEAAGDPGVFIHLRPLEDLQREAAALGAFDPDRPLWGVPYAAKDNIDVAGCPTTAACPAYAYEPSADAHVIAKLKTAGALCLGKTNLDQFATGLVGLRTPYPIPMNPIDPGLPPGGSSSGSAVAVSRGLVAFALGTDTAGSGRVPAGLNNIVGLKPSLGALSATGLVPACRSLDAISVFALTVEDAFQVFEATASYDPADAFSRPLPPPRLGPRPPKLRIGAPASAGRIFDGDAEQAERFEAVLSRLAGLGAEIVEIDFAPFHAVAEMLYDGPWIAERYAAIEPFLRERPDALHPVTLQIIAAAERMGAVDAFKALYRLADLRRAAEASMAGLDLLCAPTFPSFPRLSDLEADPIGPNTRLGVYTNFVNLLDFCGLAVPVAPRRDGLPGSVTLLGRAGADALCASMGAALMRAEAPRLGATGWALPAAPEPSPGPAAGEISMAMVGAHMSGLPLNGEATRLGARFLREARTAPCYRLYRLAGGPPMRPGLVREAEGGAAIALELWAMPESAIGPFLKGVPSPLGFGTVQLEDGGTTTGFLCEAAGLEGATDITGYGGWRAYLAAAA